MDKHQKKIFVFMGMIASGKSYLAKALAKRHGCSYYNSDVVRKEIAGTKKSGSRDSAVGEGIYGQDFSRRTYSELMERAAAELMEPGCDHVILDASYQSKEERNRVRQRFRNTYKLLFIHCIAPEITMKRRMEKRARDPRSVSDGRWEVYLEQKKRFEYPTELDKEHLIILDTDKPLAILVKFLEERLEI